MNTDFICLKKTALQKMGRLNNPKGSPKCSLVICTTSSPKSCTLSNTIDTNKYTMSFSVSSMLIQSRD